MSESSGLFRSLTTRRAKKPAEKVSPMPSRSFSTKKSSANLPRVQISAPVTLISSTNMLSYNAPDIGTMKRQPSAESANSASTRVSTEDSDRSSTGSRSASTDASSVESVPSSPEANHLTGFFDAARRAEKERHHHQSTSTTGSHHKQPSSPRIDYENKRSIDTQRSSESSFSPAIPQRARSHSKEAHERMARKRSIRNMGPPNSLHSRGPSANEQRTSVDMFKATVDPAHPFGKELEQLNEVVEELGGVIRDVAMDEDTKLMQEKGLVKYCAADYLAEIAPFMSAAFEKRRVAPTPTLSTTWI